MTIKQKFDRIDQSKLEPNQVNALKIVVDFTENFKTKDKEKIRVTNEKLDNIIGKLQEKNPNALKPIRSPRKTTNAKSSSTKTPKRNVFSVAKEIKKAGETFEEAKARASQQLKKEKEEANKTIKTEMQKLQEYIKAHKELQGISGTDLGRDAGRVAKMGGRRISKNGNIYYENRENRKDRLAPNYPKNAPLLEYGGDFQSGVYAMGGGVSEDLFENYEKQPKELSEIVDFYMNKFEEGDYDYQDSQNFLKEVEAIGYTFDYGLDNEPYGLRPIGTELNDYANGGEFMTDTNFGNFQNQVYAKGGGVEIEIKGKKHNLSMKNSITKGDRVVLRYPINNGKRSDNPLDGEVGTIIQVNKDGSYNLYEDYQKHVVKLDNGETIEELGRYMSVLMPEYADGGELVDYSENQLMVMNQNVQIEHHHEELEDVLQNKTEVPAWVVAKMATATQNISDITHYLDGERELLEEDNEEDDEEEVIVDSITIPSSISKTEQTKKFTQDALGNMKGFLKGKDGIELEDDYTFKYKGKNYEIEPVVNYNEKGVSNALFIVYNDNDEQVGEINYTSGSGKQNFTAKSDLFNWNNVKFEDGGYFDGTIPNVSSYMSNYAKGGEIDKAEIFGLKRNIMGTTDIEMKIAGMRKPQSFIVYPINKDDSADIITIQSETRIGKIDLSTGRGLMSQSHANGAYYIHLQMDKKTPFTISESDLEKLKMQIFKTAGDNVGSRGIVTDNSGASKLFAKGGGFRERNGRKYDIGRNWTKDHNYVNKSEKHEMNYNRKKSMAKGGLLTPRERYVLEIKGLTGLRVTAIENYIEENGLSNDDILNIVIGLGRRQLKGSDVATAVVGNKGNSASKKLIAFAKGNEALKMELGGAMATDLAGHTGGSMGTNTPSLLSGTSGTYYTGLVGETGAMSSGEMFSRGGGLPFGSSQSYVITEAFGNPAQHFAKGGAIKGYVEVSNPNTELFQKGYGIYGGDAWETFADIKKAFPDGLPKDAFVVKLVSGKYPSFVIAEKRTDEYNNGGSLPDGVEQSYVNYYLGSTGILAGGGSLKDAQKLNEKERFELKVLKSITGFNKGQSVGGIMQVLGFGNYKFNIYPTEEQHEKVNIALRSLKNKKFIEGDVSNKITLSDTFKITQSGADYLRSFIYGSYAGGGVIDLALNKKVYDLAKKKKFLMNDYLNDNFSVSEYNIILAQALVESLTDANFHSEAKEVVAKLEKQDWSDDLYNSKYFNADQEISEFGRDVARICDYDGDDILNAYYNLAKTQGSSVGNLIEKLFLSKSGKYEEGGEVEEAIINKDGIKVKSVAQPKNKPTEAEWLAKYNESKEARTYKSGGNLGKYSQFIQDEFPASKRLANKFSKKYDSPFLVLVEKGNGGIIYVKQAESFYAFPKSYIDAHDVLYVTPDAMAFGGFFGKKQEEAPKEKVKDFTGKEVITSDGVYVIVLMQYKDTALVKDIGNQFKDAYKIDLKKIQTPENMKMAKGGIANRGGIMLLAKQIRKDNESWKDALKRAGEQLRK